METKDEASPVEGVVSCQDCGTPHAELGVDLVLPDQQWHHIAPDAGILCPNCICKRAAKHGGTSVLAWVDNIDYSVPANDGGER